MADLLPGTMDEEVVRYHAARRLQWAWRDFSEDTRCRICWEAGGKKICNCSSFAHKSCAREWVRVGKRVGKDGSCEICRGRLDMDISPRHTILTVQIDDTSQSGSSISSSDEPLALAEPLDNTEPTLNTVLIRRPRRQRRYDQQQWWYCCERCSWTMIYFLMFCLLF